MLKKKKLPDFYLKAGELNKILIFSDKGRERADKKYLMLGKWYSTKY